MIRKKIALEVSDRPSSITFYIAIKILQDIYALIPEEKDLFI